MLYVVGTPIGNLEDISRRAVRVLGEVDVIAAEDTRRAAALLAHLGIRGPRVVSMFVGNEAARTEALIDELDNGSTIAVISDAGMPGISDPGERLVRDARARGISVEVIPGPAACIAAVVGSGLPAGTFTFVGFLPRESGSRRRQLGTLRGRPETLVVYEAPDRVAQTLADMVDAFGGDRQCVLARELTKKFEQFVSGTVAELAASFAQTPPRGECTLVIDGAGDVAPDVVDIEAAVRQLLADGLGPKDVAARLMAKTGRSRRELYQLTLSLQRERDD